MKIIIEFFLPSKIKLIVVGLFFFYNLMYVHFFNNLLVNITAGWVIYLLTGSGITESIYGILFKNEYLLLVVLFVYWYILGCIVDAILKAIGKIFSRSENYPNQF